MIKKIMLALIVIAITEACSKSNNCNCYKKLGYKEVSVIWKSNDSLVLTKRFNYQITPIFKMETVDDSVSAFMAQNYSDSVKFKQIDSIFEDEQVKKISSDETQYFTSQGYSCVCAD